MKFLEPRIYCPFKFQDHSCQLFDTSVWWKTRPIWTNRRKSPGPGEEEEEVDYVLPNSNSTPTWIPGMKRKTRDLVIQVPEPLFTPNTCICWNCPLHDLTRQTPPRHQEDWNTSSENLSMEESETAKIPPECLCESPRHLPNLTTLLSSSFRITPPTEHMQHFIKYSRNEEDRFNKVDLTDSRWTSKELLKELLPLFDPLYEQQEIPDSFNTLKLYTSEKKKAEEQTATFHKKWRTEADKCKNLIKQLDNPSEFLRKVHKEPKDFVHTVTKQPCQDLTCLIDSWRIEQRISSGSRTLHAIQREMSERLETFLTTAEALEEIHHMTSAIVFTPIEDLKMSRGGPIHFFQLLDMFLWEMKHCEAALRKDLYHEIKKLQASQKLHLQLNSHDADPTPQATFCCPELDNLQEFTLNRDSPTDKKVATIMINVIQAFTALDIIPILQTSLRRAMILRAAIAREHSKLQELLLGGGYMFHSELELDMNEFWRSAAVLDIKALQEKLHHAQKCIKSASEMAKAMEDKNPWESSSSEESDKDSQMSMWV